MRAKRTNGEGLVQLPAEATIAAAASLHEQIKAVLGRHARIRVATAELERADASLIQLLAATALSARQQGKTFTLDPSPVIDRLLAVSGCTL